MRMVAEKGIVLWLRVCQKEKKVRLSMSVSAAQ